MISKLNGNCPVTTPNETSRGASRKRRELDGSATPKTDRFFASQSTASRKKLKIEIPAPPATFDGRSAQSSSQVSPAASSASTSTPSDADIVSIKIFLYRS